MKSVAQLRDFFNLNGKAFWELYSGNRKAADRMIIKNTTESRLEQSFEMLENAINLNRSNNDSFFIVIKTNATDSKGVSNVNLDFEKTATDNKAVSGASINNDKILGLQQEFSSTIGQLNQQILELKHQQELEKLKGEHQREVDKLKLKIKEAKQDNTVNDMGKMILGQLLAPSKPVTAAVGHATLEQPKTEQHSEHHSDDVSDIDITGVDFNSVIASVSIIKSYIPNTEILLHNLSVTLDEADEEERKGIINTLNQFFG